MGTPTLIGDLYVDVVTRRAHSAPLTITTHTIEDGSQLANHVEEQVETLVLDVTLADDNQAYFGSDDALIKAQNRVTSKDAKRKALLAIKDSKEIVNVVMPDDFYPSFAIVDIQANEDNASIYQPMVILQKVRTAETTTKKVPLDRIKKKKNAAKTKAAQQQEETKDGGQKQTEAATKKVNSKTIAEAGYKYFKSFISGDQ
jgi:hypothetical protein